MQNKDVLDTGYMIGAIIICLFVFNTKMANNSSLWKKPCITYKIITRSLQKAGKIGGRNAYF